MKWGSYKMENVAIIEKIPTVKEYIQLRNSIGWNILQFDKIKKGLDNSIFVFAQKRKVVLLDSEELLEMELRFFIYRI